MRAVEPGDWESYYAWDQDDDQARRLYAVPFPRSQAAMRRWAEHEALRQADGDDFRFVIEDKAGEIVGNITTHQCDRRVGSLAYGISVLRQERGKGYAADAIALVLRYYFRELRYQKATVGVYSFNAPSIRLHQKLGFRQEGRLRRTVFTDGRFHDELRFGLTAEEFASGPAVSYLPG